MEDNHSMEIEEDRKSDLEEEIDNIKNQENTFNN